jgi:hypothetical protein
MNNSYRSLTKGCMHDFLLQKWSASWLKAFDVTLISYIDTRHKMLTIL